MAIPISSNLSKATPAIHFLLNDTDLRGGFRVVADATARDAIQMGARVANMIVFCTAEGKFFRLAGGTSNAAWQEWTVNGQIVLGDGLVLEEETGALTVDTAHLDTLYSGVEHNHDEAYAAVNHNHDSVYAAIEHDHAIEDVTGLQDVLDVKAAADHSHEVATAEAAGFMSASDKAKLNSIAADANNYSHPTGDGNLHVPATGTDNDGKVLKAGATAGSSTWAQVDYSELAGVPSTFTPSAHSHDEDYAALNHNHDSAYAPASHNHDSVYAAIEHDHVWADITDVPKVTAMPGVIVSNTDPAPTDGTDGDIWFVIPA